MPAKTSKRTNHGYRTDLLVKQSDPWAALDAIMATEPEPMGPEWLTLWQLADRFNLSRPGAQHRAEKWLREGRISVWTGKLGQSKRIGNKYRVKPQ